MFAEAVPERVSAIERRALRRVGSTLCGGRYRLHYLIGTGGTAAVYAGEHRTGYRVAIKMLHDRLSDDPKIYRQFQREARLVNRVNHPGAVKVQADDMAE